MPYPVELLILFENRSSYRAPGADARDAGALDVVGARIAVYGVVGAAEVAHDPASEIDPSRRQGISCKPSRFSRRSPFVGVPTALVLHTSGSSARHHDEPETAYQDDQE